MIEFQRPFAREGVIMSNRIQILLLLSAVPISALARQSNSSSSAQPAATSARGPIEYERPADFWDGEQPSFGALILHPLTTKRYVQRHVRPIQDRLNELDQITAENTKTIHDIDTRAQQGIQLASAKADMADLHAEYATSKAQVAQEKATALDARVTTDQNVAANLDQYKPSGETEIRFRQGQTVLSKDAKNALDEMAAPLGNQRGYVLEIQGFSAGHGQAAIANSRTVADAVVRYLVLNHEIPAYRIYVLGMGSASGARITSGSRVEVNLLKNDLEQIARH
jgi:outer membrane protein OmpA-like peptidoglycan-associated protein